MVNRIYWKFETTKPGDGETFFKGSLQASSGNTSIPHAKGYQFFINWLGSQRDHSTENTVEGRTVQLLRYLQYLNSDDRLQEKGVQSKDGIAMRAVLRSAISHIEFANKILQLDSPWPTDAAIIGG